MDIFKNTDFVLELNNSLKNGGVITFVTDTVWGVGALPTSVTGVQRIYELKGRDTSKPLILMSNKAENLMPYVSKIPVTAEKLMREHFPGALTLIFEKTSQAPDFISSGKNTIGIRVPNNKTFQRLCEVIDGHVLATTSANLSNQPAATTFQEAKNYIGDKVDYTFEDFGEKAQGLASTVALALDDNIKVLRQGSVYIH
ncbi:MAG: L-threonylcarbamoyladenylate synthase [Candidatus Gastranaerophilales bacterium]|nr:L-threonylcarbamoyladenylate synthase [Candidatus Gastranaerophilales bacterium]